MALTLETNPVQTVGGVVENIFAGFDKVEFVFQRKDMTGVSITSGTGTNIRISTGLDLSSYLSVGDAVYVYAEGSTYTYNKSGLITVVDTTYIEASIDFIENASTNSYINYFINYYIDVQCVNADNSDIKVIPFSLQDDGTDAGVIKIDVGIVNDLNYVDFEYVTQQLPNAVTKFKIQYKQVYTGSSESYTLVADEIILVYATQTPIIESFINQFDTPELYEGYSNGVMLCHSDSNNDDAQLNIVYDQLDINQNDVIIDQSLATLINEYGLYFIDFTGEVINQDTEYIKFKATFSAAPDFLPADWDSSDFATT